MKNIAVIGAVILALASLVFWVTVSNEKHKLDLGQAEIKAEQTVQEAAVAVVEESTRKRIENERNSTSEEINLSVGHHTISI